MSKDLSKSAPEAIQEMLKPLSDGKFFFACHPGVPCFTECCRDLKLMLTPYDVLRLKNHFGMSAEDFLDEYTDSKVDEQRNLTMVFLKMAENERKTCPFVSPEGCRVYKDRPAACRTYPIARASRLHRLHQTVLEEYFVLHEPHCRGFEAGRDWTMEEWTGDQGLEPYHEMNNLWMKIITHPKLRQGASLSVKQHQMFFMAAYNLDKFRQFVLGSRFLQLFELEPEEAKKLEKDDQALLKLAFNWLLFSLFNEPTLKMKQAGA